MRKVFSKAWQLGLVLTAGIALVHDAMAQQTNFNNNNTQQYGFNLPTPVNPHGYDEVRASDGTTCRSSISGGGPYLDVGGLGGQNHQGESNGAMVYGRLVIPLGKKPDRLDCGSLYQLEIERLKHELRLARSGMGVTDNNSSGDWSKTGWNKKPPK